MLLVHTSDNFMIEDILIEDTIEEILHISDTWKNMTVTWKKGLKYSCQHGVTGGGIQ